jgi:hypothetical protein
MDEPVLCSANLVAATRESTLREVRAGALETLACDTSELAGGSFTTFHCEPEAASADGA